MDSEKRWFRSCPPGNATPVPSMRMARCIMLHRSISTAVPYDSSTLAGRGSALSVSLPPPMPFTYAHPALVVPFTRFSDARGWRSALVLGAMSPDLARMIPVWGTREFTHSIAGFVFLDTPLAILLALIWSLWFAPRAIRLPGLEAMEHPWTSRSWIAIPLGALLGGATHLVWDIFTHGPPIFQAPFLERVLFVTNANYPFTIRDTNWFLHSFAGLALIGWGAYRLIGRSPGGLRSLLHPVWIRLVLAGLIPLLFSLRWVELDSPTLLSDLYQAMFRNGSRGVLLLQIATVCFFAVFLWETRRDKRIRSS